LNQQTSNKHQINATFLHLSVGYTRAQLTSEYRLEDFWE